MLASCSFDGSIVIHRESRPGEWSVLYSARIHESSVNSIQFAPQEFGLMLAAASSDGRVSVVRYDANQAWNVEYIQDCSMGVNAVSWSPHGAYYDRSNPDAPESPRLVTAGCDSQVRFYVQDPSTGQWQPDGATSAALAHSDWVRDVAWAPSLLPNHNIVASCSEDRTVLIWKQQQSDDNDAAGGGSSREWTATLLHTFDAPVWRVSWSVTGHLLAVSSGDADVTLWKAGLDGKWTQVSSVEDTPSSSSSSQAAAAAAPPQPQA